MKQRSARREKRKEMPFKDREKQLAYQRSWYAKHSQRTIAKVKKRKYELYGGTCKNCGARTIGQTKGKAAEYCHKPECLSVQRKANRAVFIEAGLKSHGKKYKKRRELRQQKVVSVVDLTRTM